jgi:hypothetical protein
VRTLVEVSLVRLANLDDLDQLPAIISQLQTGASTAPRPGSARSGARSEMPSRPAASDGQKKNGANLVSTPLAQNAAAQPPNAAARPQESPPLDEAQVQSAWRQTLAEIGDMTADFASKADGVAISAPNRLAVRFRKAYTQAVQFCERPESKQKLEQTLSRVLGRNVRIDFLVVSDQSPERSGTAVASPPRPSVNRQQRRQEVQRHPLIRRANELFETELLTVLDAPAAEDLATSGDATATGG